MPETNLMWFGNRPVLTTTSTSNATQAQANNLLNWEAGGKEQLKAVAINGSPAASNDSYGSTYQTGNAGTANMTYMKPPEMTDQVTSQIRAFMTTTFEITVPGPNGQEILTKNGVIIQMSNGDMFFRPSVTTVNEWNDITTIVSVKVVSVTPTNAPVSTIGFNADIFETDIVCFARGTMIATPQGLHKIEDLSAGDIVTTKDSGNQPIRWIGSTKLTSAQLHAFPQLLPIRICADALGAGIPSSDLLVSPQHRILVRSRIAQNMFGTDEVLVAAKQLLQLDGVDIADDLTEVEYFHILFDQHEVIMSNGAETESLYTGPEAMKSMSPAAREEILMLFPELESLDYRPSAARMLTSGRQARKLAVRHLQQNRELVM